MKIKKIKPRAWNAWGMWSSFAAIQHYAWAILLLIDVRAELATAVVPLYDDHPGVGILAVAILATMGIIYDSRRGPSLIGLVLCLPQQYMLTLSAWSAGTAMAMGIYADGVPRAHAYIAADQLPVLLILIYHSIALVRFHGQSWLESRNEEGRNGEP